MATLKARVKEGDLLNRIHQREVVKKEMPPNGLGKDLTDQDRIDIRNYLYSLTR